jgi:hypothetical protein
MMKHLNLLILLSFGSASCGSAYSARNPIHESFPEIRGNTLTGDSLVLPDALSGHSAILLIGYQQRSQFDIDRWLLGLTTSKTKVDLYELPAILGFVPGLFARGIDDGMRSGIPEEDWAQVITVYDDAEKLAQFTGNKNGLPGRIVLIGPLGKVRYFHDRGFSIGALNQLLQVIEQLDGKRGTSLIEIGS